MQSIYNSGKVHSIKWFGINEKYRQEAWYAAYNEQLEDKTKRNGTLLSLIGVPSIAFFMYQDFSYLNLTDFWPWRIFGISVLLVFLFSLLTTPAKKTKLFLYLHLLNIIGLVVMMEGMMFTLFSSPNREVEQLFATTLGYMSVWFIFAVVAAGVRPFLPLIALISMSALVAGAVIADVNLWGYVMSIVTVAVFCNYFAYRQHISEQEEWRYRHQIEANERQLRQQKVELEYVNEELESFNYTISHDLKTHIRTANGFSQLLGRALQKKDDKRANEYMDFIRNSMKRMQELLDDLLELSKIGQSRFQKSLFDLNELIAHIWHDLMVQEEKKRAELHCENLPLVYGDKHLIEQVVVNLLSNALKYSSKAENAKIEIGSYQENNGAATVVFFKDNGAGFNMTHYDHLFKPFKRLHKDSEFEGTGVGLAIAKKIINYHEGEIWATSEVGKGATFYFRLPNKPS